MGNDKIFNKLNEAQREAVTSTEGYVRVIAGAGSGKTRALTNRYAYLMRELGISPSNILCITFTNKAAKEMKKRVRLLLGDDVDTSFVATLHAFCTRILREDIGRLFYPESFIVLDNADQKKILEEVYDELDIKMDTATFKFMIDKIKYEKNLISYMDYIAVPTQNLADFVPKNLEQKIIYRYIEKQKKYFGLDFFDLINFVIYLFKHHEDVLEKWQKRLHYIMVDEFQDITAKEFKIIKWLNQINRNWFVVGDPDQNIYEWRGANMEVIMDFDNLVQPSNPYGVQVEKYYTDEIFPCKTIMMNENYRSTPEIIDVSNAVIDKNQNRIKKELFTKSPKNVLPEHYHAPDDTKEIKYICDKIGEHIANGGKYSDIAVLYRSNYVSRFIEQGFLKVNIPYTVYGGVGFYERMEIKDVLSYLRLICYGDDLSFQRIVNVPRRKMGKLKLNFLKQRAENENISLYETLVKYMNDPVFKGSGAKEFVSVIEEMKAFAKEAQVSELLQKLLIDAKYELYIRESGDMDRLDNVSELIRAIVTMENDFGEPLTLSTFLQDVSLNRDMDDDDIKDRIRIMTAHTAKGLEFDVVFIVGLSDGTFPSARALEERREAALEEERRLMYVAMTRAKKRLYLTESEGLGFRGYTKVPMRFLFDISDDIITRIGHIDDNIMEEFRFQIRERREPGKAIFAVGAQVRHKVFGEGIVEEIDEVSKTYLIRFMQGIKPINFDYMGLSEVF